MNKYEDVNGVGYFCLVGAIPSADQGIERPEPVGL